MVGFGEGVIGFVGLRQYSCCQIFSSRGVVFEIESSAIIGTQVGDEEFVAVGV